MKQPFIVICLIIFVFLSFSTFSQDDSSFECPELQDPNPRIPPQRGGRYFTEQGVVKAMVIFVQFAGDTTKPGNQTWPLNQPPNYFKKVLDSTLTPQTADSGSLSHWYREMSFSKLKMIGDAYFVITDSSKQWYLDHNKNYGHVNKDVLMKLDPQVDFSQYDNWTFGYNNPYHHANEPDSIADMIIIIYRENLAYPITYPPNWGNGVATLGYISDFTVEGGSITIQMGFPGSGVSIEKGYWGRRTHWYAHEIGHLLLGSGHPGYHKDNQTLGVWGILFSNSYLVNAYDRHWLRWVDYNNLDISDSLDISVSDFLSTGDAYRIALPGTSDEAFFIENHQELSYFDQWVNWDGSEKGLYIYHIKGTGAMPRVDVEVAEGSFNWSNPYWIQNPWNSNPLDSIPVFDQGIPNRTGYDGRDAIPTSKGGTHKIFVTDNDNGDNWDVDRRVFGSELDAFDVGYNEIFSPWSNPNSNRWNDIDTSGITIEIRSIHQGSQGEDIYNLRIRTVNGENGPPSNPLLLSVTSHSQGGNQGLLLTWAENQEPDIDGYEVYYKKNTQPIRKLSGSNLVHDTTWVHWGVDISELELNEHTYYVVAVDSQGKSSNYSNGISVNVEYIKQGGADKIAASNPETPIS